MSAVSSALSSLSHGELFSSFRRKIYVEHFTGVFNSLEQHLSLWNASEPVTCVSVWKSRKREHFNRENLWDFLNSLLAKLMTSLDRSEMISAAGQTGECRLCTAEQALWPYQNHFRRWILCNNNHYADKHSNGFACDCIHFRCQRIMTDNNSSFAIAQKVPTKIGREIDISNKFRRKSATNMIHVEHCERKNATQNF